MLKDCAVSCGTIDLKSGGSCWFFPVLALFNAFKSQGYVFQIVWWIYQMSFLLQQFNRHSLQRKTEIDLFVSL
jgi:hypothetical protein